MQVFCFCLTGEGGVNDCIMDNVEINVEMVNTAGDSYLFYKPCVAGV